LDNTRTFGDKTLKVYSKISEKKLTAANSFFCEEVPFYIAKKNENDKAIKMFAGYLYPSGILITSDFNKDNLKKRLEAGMDLIKTFIEDYDI